MAIQRGAAVEAAAQRTADRVREGQQRIAVAVASLQSGEQWREFLGLPSRLHAYSAKNTLLIALAHHAAWERGEVSRSSPSLVAGSRTWRSVGRSVAKGQHGYPILAPNRHWQRAAVYDTGHQRRLGRHEAPGATERVDRRRVVSGLRLAHGSAVELVASAAELDGANGVTLFDSGRVLVRSDMDPAARVKTLIHELGHVLLHHPDTIAEQYGDQSPPSRAAMEVEAESVAFIVADAHGLATGAYSFPYVATWAGDGVVEVVQASASRVAAAARQVVEASPAAHTAGGRLKAVDRTTDREPPSITWSADPGPTVSTTAGPEVA